MSDNGPEIEGQGPSDAPEAQTPNPQGGTVLRVASPWCTAITFPDYGGGTLVVTQQGVHVLTKDADALIETAALHGVTLTKVSE